MSTLQGIVMRHSISKTARVEVKFLKKHKLYAKTMKLSTTYLVHDPANNLQAGDVVKISLSRPISKLKRWVLTEIIKRGFKYDSDLN